MHFIQTIKDDLKQTRTLDLLSNALIEISSIKMRTFRRQLTQNAEFYTAIQEIYREVKGSGKARHLLTQIIPDTNLVVGLTSNRRFYGMQNIDIIKKFLEDLQQNPADGLVVGLTGKTYLSTVATPKPIEVILFKDDFPTTREIYQFLDQIKHYEKVFLYHPQFVNLMSQKTVVTDITYNLSRAQEEKTVNKNYIFEPELPQIISFFETHVRFLLFRRSLLEVELARTSARLVAMIKAEERSSQMIETKKRQLRLAQKSLINARLLEGLSGARRWSKIWYN